MMRASYFALALAIFLSVPAVSRANEQTVTVAIVEALKPNVKANWTDFARQEYELGIRIGQSLCDSSGVTLETSRHYFAGHADKNLKTFQAALRELKDDFVVIPGNSANALSVAEPLEARWSLSPFTQSHAVHQRMKHLVVPVPSVNTMASFIINQVPSEHLVVALYDPTVRDTAANASAVEDVARKAGHKVVKYPVAEKEKNHSDSLVQFLKAKGWKPDVPLTFVTSIDTRIIAPFLTSIDKSMDFQSSALQLFGLASFPPQFRQQVADIKRIKVRDIRVKADVQKNDIWMIQAVGIAAKELNLTPRSELSVSVAEVLWLICTSSSQTRARWSEFQKRVSAHASSKELSLVDFHKKSKAE
jgi:hypothetical protein